MIPIPSGVRVFLATGHTDMRRGMQSLALTVRESLKRDPHAGDLYIFRGRRGDLVKILWHDGIGDCRSMPSVWTAASSSGPPRPARAKASEDEALIALRPLPVDLAFKLGNPKLLLYGIGEDGVQAFTDFGIKNLVEFVRSYKENRTA
jgi:hypothetical protein